MKNVSLPSYLLLITVNGFSREVNFCVTDQVGGYERLPITFLFGIVDDLVWVFSVLVNMSSKKRKGSFPFASAKKAP